MPASPRRWFAFRLRTLFVVVAVVIAPACWLAQQWRIVQARKAAIAVRAAVPIVDPSNPGQVQFIRRMMGDSYVSYLYTPGYLDVNERRRIEALFPEAKTGPIW